MTGRESFHDASESRRSLGGGAEGKDVTGPRAVPLRPVPGLGGDGFPRRYQRGGICPAGRTDTESGHVLPMRVVPRKLSFRLFIKEGDEGFFAVPGRMPRKPAAHQILKGAISKWE